MFCIWFSHHRMSRGSLVLETTSVRVFVYQTAEDGHNLTEAWDAGSLG
jgi:hypothetical protein